jgi:hypothetical protein
MSPADTNTDLAFETLLDDPACQKADARAVMDHAISRTPLDPNVARRVEARAKRITEEIRRRFGIVDIAVDLIREGRDEE